MALGCSSTTISLTNFCGGTMVCAHVTDHRLPPPWQHNTWPGYPAVGTRTLFKRFTFAASVTQPFSLQKQRSKRGVSKEKE
jgi:hypothetical protein